MNIDQVKIEQFQAVMNFLGIIPVVENANGAIQTVLSCHIVRSVYFTGCATDGVTDRKCCIN